MSLLSKSLALDEAPRALDSSGLLQSGVDGTMGELIHKGALVGLIQSCNEEVIDQSTIFMQKIYLDPQKSLKIKFWIVKWNLPWMIVWHSCSQKNMKADFCCQRFQWVSTDNPHDQHLRLKMPYLRGIYLTHPNSITLENNYWIHLPSGVTPCFEIPRTSGEKKRTPETSWVRFIVAKMKVAKTNQGWEVMMTTMVGWWCWWVLNLVLDDSWVSPNMATVCWPALKTVLKPNASPPTYKQVFCEL